MQFYFKWYDKSRKEKKIYTRIIAHSKDIKRIPLAEIRYLPEKYSNPVSVNTDNCAACIASFPQFSVCITALDCHATHAVIHIYQDKVAIILWAIVPLAIVIKNKEISGEYKSYFELMWKIAKK